MAKKSIKDKKTTDVMLMKAYNLGWDDCFGGDNSNIKKFKKNKLLIRAYNIGWCDYIVGDDVSSCDNQSKEEILKHIKAIEKSLV